MRVLAGLSLGGPAFVRRTESTTLGGPIWGPAGLLRDLELRLGLPPIDESASRRVPRWTARIKALADERAFYNSSFVADELGTAEALLAWRDALVEAGWNGNSIADGGERLAALAAVEQQPEGEVPPGRADRITRVQGAHHRHPSRVYESVTLIEDADLWPGRWRDVFRQLSATGTSFERHVTTLPGAPPASDLGLLQARIRGEKVSGSVRGDGTLLVLRGDTPGDLAELTAAMLAMRRGAETTDVVIRCRDAESLEAALARHGLPTQGCASESVWRPAMQVLPLAVELAYEPRDPYRVLELLTLPVGPFRGLLGTRLARAVARQPGVAGKEWTRQKTEAARHLHDQYARMARAEGKPADTAEEAAKKLVAERLSQVASWLEAPGAGPVGALKSDLLAVSERVRTWLQSRIRGGEVDVYGAAYAQAIAFGEALSSDTRELFTLEDARQLLDRFARCAQAHDLSVESSGRAAHVSHPASLLAPCDGVFLWSFVGGVERRPPRLPWNEQERAALLSAGVVFAEPSSLLRVEAEAWRRAVLAARERVVFVVPRTIKGTATASHPLWDEICARLGLDDAGVERITREARRVLARGGAGLVRVVTVRELPLPEGRGVWNVPAAALRASGVDRKTSVTALEKIATCPLAWVLEQRADLRSGAMSKVATGVLLHGGVGHRLVEELHGEGAFGLAEDAFVARAMSQLDGLLQREGATLLLPGASIERLQLASQMRRGVRALYRYLADSGHRIAAVEEEIGTESAIGPLHGRLDLRLVDSDGRSAILDLKWGASTYRELLQQGRAVQLAVYARAVAGASGASRSALPPAAYFALGSGQVLAMDRRMKPSRPIEGPTLEDTWRRVEATARAVISSHGRGEVYVAAAKRSLALLDALGIDDAERAQHFETAPTATCNYCEYDALCGRKWAALT